MNSKSSAPSGSTRTHVAVCLRAKGRVDLQPGRVYKVIPDREAAGLGCVRVVDGSGEDYLYPKSAFRVVKVSAYQARQLLRGVEA